MNPQLYRQMPMLQQPQPSPQQNFQRPRQVLPDAQFVHATSDVRLVEQAVSGCSASALDACQQVSALSPRNSPLKAACDESAALSPDADSATAATALAGAELSTTSSPDAARSSVRPLSSDVISVEQAVFGCNALDACQQVSALFLHQRQRAMNPQLYRHMPMLQQPQPSPQQNFQQRRRQVLPDAQFVHSRAM